MLRKSASKRKADVVRESGDDPFEPEADVTWSSYPLLPLMSALAFSRKGQRSGGSARPVTARWLWVSTILLGFLAADPASRGVMTAKLNSAAPGTLPPFITEPGETDFLLVIIGCGLIALLVTIGVLYFRLHALPEHMAHRSQSTQMQLVGVLGLLALFTHNNLFWVAALLIAALRIPDVVTPLRSLARSASASNGCSST